MDPDNFTITHGPMVEDAPLSRAISLGLSDNTTHVMIERGQRSLAKAELEEGRS